MKKDIGYIFIDDGYPEASDYDSNFITYDKNVPGAARAALKRAGLESQLPVINKPDSESGKHSRCSAGGYKRPRICVTD